jgi:hypothetical protein
MKYLLAGLGAYSIGVGSWFFMENQTPTSLLVGWGLGLLLLIGSIALFAGGK